ncbi:MAG: biotin--[acetyl-CoA-carboxylase] ligase [Tenericutes bacterium]|jgi:BirA family transcriptional regulator, biotin operon repressor / biotin---[acetyl-CoA-carboxylase] ligase|nr:biotin--[acetyl-CoA-carboxylase] ligase [Mycoplasmatota bacterium]
MISYTLLEFDTLTSTSDFLKENYSYFPHMTLIKASFQSQGRGQYDRTWESNPNENLLFSILLKDINVSKAYEIKLWVMETLVQHLQNQGINVYFKEPNDLYVGDKKICGILIETKSSENNFDYVVIGIGLNINQTEFKNFDATSIKNELHQSIDIKKHFNQLLNLLVNQYEKYIKLK